MESIDGRVVAAEEQHTLPWLPPVVVSEIIKWLDHPREVLAAGRVSKAWYEASTSPDLWEPFLVSAFGSHLAERIKQRSVSKSPVELYKAHIAFGKSSSSFCGWCEDKITAGGRPYAMSVSIADKVKHNSLGKPVLQSVCSWAYAEPPPRTHMSISMQQTFREDHPSRACTAGPSSTPLPQLYSFRLQLLEAATLPGSGPVNVPNLYAGFLVGPVIIGTFNLPDVPLHILRLVSRSQGLGVFCLWPKEMQLTAEDRARQLRAQGGAAGGGGGLHNLAAANGCCPGAVLSGSVVANFLTQDLSRPGLHQGRPLLGQVHVTVKSVVPPTTTPPSTSPATSDGDVVVAVMELSVHMPQRLRVVVPTSGHVPEYKPQEEESYTSELTCKAAVELLADGRLRPVPAAAASVVLGEPAWALLGRQLAQRLSAGDRTQPVTELVDDISAQLTGHLAGGIMCGLLVHPVVGRAAFVASTKGLKGLCQLGGGV